MKVGERYFVRVDKKANTNPLDDATRKAYFKYLKELSSMTRMFAGGFNGAHGGMIVFVAKDFSDAEEKCKRDPVIEKGFYEFDLYDWTVQLMS